MSGFTSISVPEPAPSALASAALDQSRRFSGRSGLLDPASVPPQALDMPLDCSSGISNLGNFCLLHHVVGFSPGWSDSLSLHFRLDDLDLHCVFDLLVHLGEYAFPASCHLEDVGLLHLRWVHGWLDTCVRNLFTGSLLCRRLSVLRVLNLLRDFRNVDDLLHHLWFFARR